jgi:hypothetical protein
MIIRFAILSAALSFLGVIAAFGQTAIKPASTTTTTRHPHTAGANDPHKPENKVGRIPYLDYKNGFLDIKFGTPVESLQGMNLVDDLGELKIYKKANEIQHLGQATVQSISYEFFGGKLMSIDLSVTGKRNSDALLQLLQAAYGHGIRPKPEVENTFWTGHIATAHYVLLSENDGYLRISNVELDKLYGDYEKKVTLEDAARL